VVGAIDAEVVGRMLLPAVDAPAVVGEMLVAVVAEF
jgi:hypothetical protein